jgi:hypothetical protein
MRYGVVKKTAFILLIFAIISNANAYWSGSSGYKHEQVAQYVLDYPTIKPYIDELVKYYGFSKSSMINTANSEPDPHRGWGFISSTSSLHGMELSNYNIGTILHAAADGSVGSKHEPAILESTVAHDIWEATAETISLPTLSYSADVLMGSFSTKMDTVYAEQIAVDQDYKNWYDDQIVPLPYDNDIHTMISQGLDNSLEMGEATLKEYFDYKQILCPSYVMADWRFDEGSDQYAYSSKGSITADLQLGSSTGSTNHDADWSTSGYNRSGAIRTYLYSSKGYPTYARSTSKWTVYEGKQLTPSGSYSIEFIVSPASLPTTAATNNDNPQSLIYCYDYNNATNASYLMSGFFKQSVGGSLHDFVSFGVTCTDNNWYVVSIDLTAAGINITPGKWYYVAADYWQPATRLKMMVKDLATDKSIEQFITCPAMAQFNSSSQPRLYIGTEGGIRCFDGRIDRARINNIAVGGSQRLFNDTTIADWKFNENSGQLVNNSNGSGTARLQFGALPTDDSSDPTWTTGRDGSAMLGRKYTSGNVAVYAQNMGWTLKDAEAFCPGNSYSIETMVNPSSYATSGAWNNINPMGLVKFRDTAGTKTQYNLQTFTDNDSHRKVRFYTQHDDGTYTDFTFDPQAAGLAIKTGTWYYIAAIYTDNGTGSGTLELIVRNMSNGATVSGSTACKPMASLTADPAVQMLIGSEYTNSSGRCFDGKIDEVRISNKAVPEAGRLSNSWTPVTVPLTLVGYWPLNGNANDASGHGNNGTSVGGLTWVAGQKGQCANFNGVDSGITIANPANFEFDDEVSLSFWVNQDDVALGAYSIVINKFSNTMSALSGLMVFSGQAAWTATGMNAYMANTIEGGHSITSSCVGSWHHVAVTYKGKDVTAYYDSQLATNHIYQSNGLDILTTAAGYPLAFGHKSNTAGDIGTFWSGKLDEVRFYHGTLTQADVINLYQQDGGILCQHEPIAEDINQDCRVDFEDLAMMMAQWLWRGYN